jgi:hypothetical protein
VITNFGFQTSKMKIAGQPAEALLRMNSAKDFRLRDAQSVHHVSE